MRLRRALALALVAGLLLTPQVPVGAQAPPAPGAPPVPAEPPQAALPTPLERLLQDLAGFFGQAGQVGGQVAPPADGVPVPSPGRVLDRGNATAEEAREDLEEANGGAIRTLFYEGFEGSRHLGELGWEVEVLKGQSPWGIVDRDTNVVVRADGSTFEPKYDIPESPVTTKDGSRAATILNPKGRYDSLTDARLVSPVIDLRYVRGASARTDAAYEVATRDPTLGEPYRLFLAFWRANLAPVSQPPGSESLGGSFNWLLTTPPSQIQRLYLGRLHDSVNMPCIGLFFFGVCGGKAGDEIRNPLHPRYGGALVNLTFYHKYDLTDTFSPEVPRAFLDGLFLEARVVHPDGTLGRWEHLAGDAVFEPEVPFAGPARVFFIGAHPSGLAESTGAFLSGEQEYVQFFSYYNGRVQLEDPRQCLGGSVKTANCRPDAPAFVSDSNGQRWKSHFTLNRFAGHEIQLAWRFHSGFSSVSEKDVGWFVDAVRVEALLPVRDPGVDRVVRPRHDDRVPSTALVVPEAVIKNYGYQRADNLTVNFTVVEDVLFDPPAESLVRGLAGQDPRTVPATAVALAQGKVAAPRVVMQATVGLPQLGPWEEARVRSPLACLACAPGPSNPEGRFRLRVEVSTATLSGGEPGSLPTDRVEEGSPFNNNVTVPFRVHDAPAARLGLALDAASLLTDVNEPKVLRLELENRGNIELTGAVEVTATPLDQRTLAPLPGQPPFPAGSLVVGPGDLPPGLRATSYGSAANTLAANLTWTPLDLPPGVYRLEAVFHAAPRLDPPPRSAINAFIRATPTAYFPGDGRPAEDFERTPPVRDGFGADRLPYAGLTHRGARTCETCGGALAAYALPLGAVSTNKTWNATGLDGPFVEATALGVLEGSNPGVEAGSVRAVVRFGPDSVRVCRAFLNAPEECTNQPYNADTTASQLVPPYNQHSYLNDYYLTRAINLTRCVAPCNPVLSFWHAGNFQWAGTGIDEVPVPGERPLRVPGAVQGASGDQTVEPAKRGLVEVVVLDDQGVTLRQDALPDDLASPCATAPCASLAPVPCASGALLPAGAGDAPLLGPSFGESVGSRSTCLADVARRPVGDATVVAEYRTRVPTWERAEVSLAPFAGRVVALSFHFQTSVERRAANPSDHWSLDNIQLRDASAAGPSPGLPEAFLDTAGDYPGDEQWRNWSRYRVLRDVVDANVALHPSCLTGVRSPASTGNLPSLDTRCLQSSRLRGPVVAIDGRGWGVFLHNAKRLETELANDPDNPYYDGWFLQSGVGFQPPGREDLTRSRAMRWGGPGDGGTYPRFTSYNLAATPLLDLQQAARPFAAFMTNISLSRINVDGLDPLRPLQDGAAVFLARHVQACEAERPDVCRYVPDRRVLLVPEAGYNARIRGTMEDPVSMNIPWTSPLLRHGANNGFGGRTGGNPLVSEWVPVRFDLTQAVGALCLKAVTLGTETVVRSYSPALCEAFKTAAATVTWENGRGFNQTSGESLLNLTSFGQDPGALYALEFHAQNQRTQTLASETMGWLIDDLQVVEQHLANDVGVSRVVFPRPGALVGPGEEVKVEVNVTNYGLFTQRGLRLHLNVTQQGLQVFPDPSTGQSSLVQALPRGRAFPGLRDPNPQRNVSVTFDTPWVPPGQGLFTINAWTEIAGEVVGGVLVPLTDENRLNDIFTQDVEVREVHSVRLLTAGEHPDSEAVQPLVGTVADMRGLRVLVENMGTVAEGNSVLLDLADPAKGRRWLNVSLTIADEQEKVVAQTVLPVDRVLPGHAVPADFGRAAWQPPHGGLFTLRFEATSDLDLLPGDNVRTVRVLVLSQLIPREGAPWTALVHPEGAGWSNETRASFAAGEGWSFGRGDRYAPGQAGALVLDAPVDLASFRNAVLTLRHRYDFEQGYDGGVLEISADGRTWDKLEPVGGYPGALTSASPEVADPAAEVRAFTGSSGGIVTTAVPIASAAISRSDPVVLLADDFDRTPLLAGTSLPDTLGRWEQELSSSEPPAGRAWWANKSIVWRPSFAADTTIEGRKELLARADGGLVVPALDSPLVVEYDEWRALGSTKRGDCGTCSLQGGYVAPNGVEVTLERLNASNVSHVTLAMPVLPRTTEATDLYNDNYMDWTRRTVILPPTQVRQLHGEPVRLAFRMYLANSNGEGGGPYLNVDRAAGSGSPEDTDYVSPHLGWAIASPKVYFLTDKATCDGANLTFRGARCLLFDDPLEYDSPDGPGARANWTASWRTATYTPASNGNPANLWASDRAGGDAFRDGGWDIVEQVGFLSGRPVWDTAAASPPRAGRGRVVEATGSGQDARLVTPLNLRSATGDAVLALDHSFKLADLQDSITSPAVTFQGGTSGARVEVSRDGGLTWEPLAPVVDGFRNPQEYGIGLRAQGFFPTYANGTPPEQQRCARPAHPGCISPANPFRAPGGWTGGGQPHAWEPQLDISTHTPLAGALRDPERNSGLGIGSMAFAGTTCHYRPAEEAPDDGCGGAEDWRRVRFDLSPYAGQEVLLGFRAWFSTHRFVRDAHTVDGGTEVVPRDFWRIDNVTVEARVLEGRPFFIRARAFSDGSGEAYGWDILNITLLGDRHLRNVGVRIASPASGEHLAGAVNDVVAHVVNQGQEPQAVRATVFVEQAGAAALANGTFEDFADGRFRGWDLAWSAPEVTLGPLVYPVEGARAALVTVPAANARPNDPFGLAQTLRVPPGHWVLRGFADVANHRAGTNGGAGVTLVGALGPDGRPDPVYAFPQHPAGGSPPASLRYAAFAFPFKVENVEADVALVIHAARVAFGGTQAFAGTVALDALSVEHAPPAGAAPLSRPLANPGFEDGAANWTLVRGQARPVAIFDKFTVDYPTSLRAVPERNANVRGTNEVEFAVPIGELNLTTLAFVLNVTGASASARLLDDRITVTLTTPAGDAAPPTTIILPAGFRYQAPDQTVDQTSTLTLARAVSRGVEVEGQVDGGALTTSGALPALTVPLPGAEVRVQRFIVGNSPLVNDAVVEVPGNRAVPNVALTHKVDQVASVMFTVNFPEAPKARVVDASSPEEAIAAAGVPATDRGTGAWRVRVRIEADETALQPLDAAGAPVPPGLAQENHNEDHVVTLRTNTTSFAARALPLDNPSALASVPQGTKALSVVGTGLGAGDFELRQQLALQPGKYRLDGLFGSRGVNWTLTPDREGEGLAMAPSGVGARQVVQTLRAADLPRHVARIGLWGPSGAPIVANAFDASLEDEHGTVLAAATNVAARASAFDIPLVPEVHIPLGVETLLLRLTARQPFQLQVHDDEAYPPGTLRNASSKDLRAVFKGPLDPVGGTALLWTGGGPATANADRTLDTRIGSTTGYPLRQVVEVPAAVRKVVTVTARVELPARASQSFDAAQTYTLREGAVKAMLFDALGQPLSEEATVSFLDIVPPAPNAASLPKAERTARFSFTNAALPPGAERFQVGLRAVNFTAVGLVALMDHRSALEGDPAAHALDGHLALNGVPLLLRTGCDLATADDDESAFHRAHGCDLSLAIGYQREGAVTIDVEGAQGGAVRLAQPTRDRTVLTATRHGAFPFAYDFIVPAGPTCTPRGERCLDLRIRADQWQGEAILDAFALRPLGQPSAAFTATVLPGVAEPLRDAQGRAPRVVAVPGASYTVTAQVVAVDATGRALGELVLGDNLARVTTGPALGPGRIVIERIEADPNSVNLTTLDRVQLRLTLRNVGNTEAQLMQARGRLETRAGEPVLEAGLADFDPPPDSLSLAPGEAGAFAWPFEPDPTMAHGVYRFLATLQTLPVGDTVVAGSAAETLVYIGTDFHHQFGFEWPFGNATREDAFEFFEPLAEAVVRADRWTSDATWNSAYPPGNGCERERGGNAQNDPCIASDGSGSEVTLSMGKNWMWRRTAAVNQSAFRGLSMGGDRAFPVSAVQCCQNQATAEGTIFAVLRSPAINITDMVRPQLIYATRFDFNSPEPEGTVYARLLDLRDREAPAEFPPNTSCKQSGHIAHWPAVETHITRDSPGFAANKWVTRTADLGPLMDLAREAGDVERWTHAQVCWHLEQPNTESIINQWSIDDVAMTPYGMGLGPGQRIPIGDNVTKDFRLVLRNRGGYTDTYDVRLEEETGLASKGPANWKVELLDEEGSPLREVRVQPGDQRTVTVRVHIDVAAPTLAREGAVDIAVTAISRTTAILRSTQHLLFDYRYPDRPNLRVAGLIVNDATLSVDKPRTVDVLVQNTGTVPALGAEMALVDKMDPAFGIAPESLRRVDGTAPPPFDLAPGDTRIVTFNWIPRVAGEHNLTAIADPDQRLLEFEERDNVMVKPILVPEAEFPDLVVEARADNRNPGPGDLVGVQVRIANRGGAPAVGVQVSILAGVTDLLPGQPPHLLPRAIAVGGEEVIDVAWRPSFPGEQTIIVRAKTVAGVLERLETGGDNHVLLVVKVRSRGLDVVAPQDLPVAPGETVEARVEVRNRGDVDDTYVLRLEPPDDWRARWAGEGETTRVSVGNHTARNLTLVVTAPRDPEAGPYPIALQASSENGTETLRTEAVVVIPQTFGIRFTLEPDHLLQPGSRYLPLELRNGGNGLDFVTVRGRRLPEGWSVEPATFPVGPRARSAVQVNLTLPTSTPEGAYPIVLEAQGKGGALLTQRALVQVLPLELLALEVQGLPALLVPGQAFEGRLVVRNDGNVPARADLAVQPPAGWASRLERDVVSMGPGESRTLALGLTVPANATGKAQPLAATALSGRDARYEEVAMVRPARADLAVVDVEQQPRGQVREGTPVTVTARVANLGEVPLRAAVAVYVDDQLLGFEPGPVLEPGAEARVNASFRARPGEHVVLAVVDPGHAVGEDDESNNARLLVQRTDGAGGFFAVPGPPLWAAALLAAAVALALRRRKVVAR